MTTKTILSRYLTIPELARQIDWEPLRLRRHLLERERKLGKPFMLRTGGTRRPKYRLTLAMVRRHLPELIDAERELSNALRDYQHAVAERIDERCDELVSDRVASLVRQNEKLLGELFKVDARLKRIEREMRQR